MDGWHVVAVGASDGVSDLSDAAPVPNPVIEAVCDHGEEIASEPLRRVLEGRRDGVRRIVGPKTTPVSAALYR
ncbi:MAG: hypothetical protein P8R42_04910 [Candidatus Binatia bacterium]|nr:hypothetical protein [Candidatus Binatia bacterium]